MRIRVEFFVAIILAGGVCNPRATLAGGTCSLTHGASYTDSTLLFTYDPANASNMTQVSYYNCSNAAPLFEGRCNNGDVQKGFLNSINGLYMCNGTRWSRYSAPACQPNDGTTFLNTYILGSTTYYQIAISDNAYILYYKQANSGSMRNPCMYTKSTYDALMEQAKKHCTDSGGFVEKPGTLSLINCACMNEGLQKKDRMTCECQDGTVYDRRNKRCIVDQNSLPPPQQTNGGGGWGSVGSNSVAKHPAVPMAAKSQAAVLMLAVVPVLAVAVPMVVLAVVVLVLVVALVVVLVTYHVRILVKQNKPQENVIPAIIFVQLTVVAKHETATAAIC